VTRIGEYGPGGTKAIEGPMCKESCKEKLCLRGVTRIGESGPGGTRATERPMCKESCKEKGYVCEGWPD
jgi:hypothetical protein